MSGCIYDTENYAFCEKCGSEMWTSAERNFYGPMCKNKFCDGGIMDAIYVIDKIVFRYKKLNKIINKLNEKI